MENGKWLMVNGKSKDFPLTISHLSPLIYQFRKPMREVIFSNLDTCLAPASPTAPGRAAE
jgi:hypothetical protein